MVILQRLTDGEIKALADGVLGPEMGDLGFAGVVVSHRDLYGEGPSLFVDAKVAGTVPAPFDGVRFERFRRLLREALFERGEERVPHLGLERAGDEQPEPDHIPVDP